MSRLKPVLVLVVTTLLAGCSSGPPMDPLRANSSVIGISVTVRAAIRFFHRSPDTVYFVKLREGENVSTGSNVIPSNYKAGDYVYLLDAEPGRYVVVATFEAVDRFHNGYYQYSTEFLTDEIVRLTEVTVKPSTVNFMGKFIINASSKKEIDATQENYMKQLGPSQGLVIEDWLFTGQSHRIYQGVLHEKKPVVEAHQDFIAFTRKRFADTAWVDIIPELRAVESP